MEILENSAFMIVVESFFFSQFVGWYSQIIDSYRFSDVKPIIIGQGEIAEAFHFFSNSKGYKATKWINLLLFPF